MSDARALSYHDVVLLHTDVDLLRGPQWLNDSVSAAAHNITITTAAAAVARSGKIVLGTDQGEGIKFFCGDAQRPRKRPTGRC
jgi:hypothetical protein